MLIMLLLLHPSLPSPLFDQFLMGSRSLAGHCFFIIIIFVLLFLLVACLVLYFSAVTKQFPAKDQ